MDKNNEVVQSNVLAKSTSYTDSEISNRPRPSWKRKVGKVLWDSLDKPKDERIFLFKLDAFFLSSVGLGYFIKTLNLNNVKYAYINGMQEDLGLKGTDFNIIQTCWSVGYIIGQIPSQLILHHVPARYYLGSLELIWTALTFLTVTVNSYNSMCALRFFVGLTEAGFFPGVEYLMGSWYEHEEITTRSTFFAQSGVAASLISGVLQAGIMTGLKGVGSFPTYRWVFILDAVISFPVAIYTFFANPNTPDRIHSWYFNERDREIARERRERIGAKPGKAITWAAVKRLSKSWVPYIFPFLFLAYNNSCNVNNQPAFQDWLKSLGYDEGQYNIYPTAVDGIGIGISIVFAWICYWFGGVNWPFVALFFICEIIGCAILATWDVNMGAHWFAYFLTGVPTAWGQPMIFSWVNQLLYKDNEVRNLAVVLTNNLAYVTNAFVPIFTWSAADMPRYFIGFTYTACLSAFGLVLTAIATYLTYRREALPVDNSIVESLDSEAGSEGSERSAIYK